MILRVFKALWTTENPAFDGEFFRFRDIGFAPKPAQKPHPPLWVGGNSPGAFRRVVALGDGGHASPRSLADFREGLAKLRSTAEAARRPSETIEISLRFGLSDALLAQGPQAAIDQLGEYKRLGIRHALAEFRRDEAKRMLEILDLVAKTIRPAVDAA